MITHEKYFTTSLDQQVLISTDVKTFSETSLHFSPNVKNQKAISVLLVPTPAPPLTLKVYRDDLILFLSLLIQLVFIALFQLHKAILVTYYLVQQCLLLWSSTYQMFFPLMFAKVLELLLIKTHVDVYLRS